MKYKQYQIVWYKQDNIIRSGKIMDILYKEKKYNYSLDHRISSSLSIVKEEEELYPTKEELIIHLQSSTK